MKKWYWAIMVAVGLCVFFFIRSCNTMGEYIYVENDGYNNVTIHTDKKCKELKSSVEFMKPYILYHDNMEYVIEYCPKCVKDWQYDELIKIKRIVNYQLNKENEDSIRNSLE